MTPCVSLGTRQLVTFLRAKSAKHGFCWWRQEAIADVMERGLRTVNRQIGEAVAAGLLRSERHGHGNYYTPCDLAEKVAYRDVSVENAVENHPGSVVVGASDTPKWRIARPPISITEILKPEKNHQSEYPVQEHGEPVIARIEPSPFEKAQVEVIANAVRACRFEPNPELIAKLERKRRHYRVTGFRVAAIITRAFKLVEGTSNAPRTEAWFTAVVENALRNGGGARNGTASEPPTAHRPRWTPAPTPAPQNLPGPVPGLVAAGDQVGSPAMTSTQAPEPESGEEAQRAQTAPIGKAPIGGMPEHEHQRPHSTIATKERAPELSLEDRRLLAELRRTYKFASHENLLEAVAEMRATRFRTIEEPAAAVQPRPPKSELGPPCELATATGAR